MLHKYFKIFRLSICFLSLLGPDHSPVPVLWLSLRDQRVIPAAGLHEATSPLTFLQHIQQDRSQKMIVGLLQVHEGSRPRWSTMMDKASFMSSSSVSSTEDMPRGSATADDWTVNAFCSSSPSGSSPCGLLQLPAGGDQLTGVNSREGDHQLKVFRHHTFAIFCWNQTRQKQEEGVTCFRGHREVIK